MAQDKGMQAKPGDIWYLDFEPALLTYNSLTPFESRPIKGDPKNTYNSVTLFYDGKPNPRIITPMLESVMLIEKPDEEGNTNPALLTPLNDKSWQEFLDKLYLRVCAILEELRAKLGFNVQQKAKFSMDAFTRPLYGQKTDSNGVSDPNKAPCCFLRVKKWTRIYSPFGTEMAEPDRSLILKSQVNYFGFIKLVYIYSGAGKNSLQYHLDELTVASVKPRTYQQSPSTALENWKKQNPNAEADFYKGLQDVKKAEDEARNKVGTLAQEGSKPVIETGVTKTKTLPPPPSNETPEDFDTDPVPAPTDPTKLVVPKPLNLNLKPVKFNQANLA